MNIRIYIIGFLAILTANVTPLLAGQNLLSNGDFESGEGKNVPQWLFLLSHLPPDLGDKGQLTWGSFKESSGNKCLKIATTASIKKLHIYWAQEKRPVTAGGAYHLKFRVKGSFEKQDAKDHGKPDIGVYFRDSEGQWIGHMQVPDVEFTDDWKEYQLDFTIPDNAGAIGVRFGVDAYGGLLTLLADDVVLEERGQ